MYALARRSKGMSSKWAFIGGILVGIAGIFTAAAVSVELEKRKDGRCNAEEEPKRLALSESEGRYHHS